jgi:tRNA (guanine37-N1)-methyltransferase
MICGRYEGIDERVKKFVDEEISIGDYVLTGGEIPAMAVVDSISRLIPEVLGNKESLNEESFSLIRNSLSSEASTQGEKFKISARGGSALGGQNSSLEYPQYTRPEVLEIKGKKLRVPKVLLSGNHKNIEDWRKKQSKIKKIKL